MKRLLLIPVALIFVLPLNAQHKNLSVADRLNEEYCTGIFRTTDGTILDVSSSTSTSGYNNILLWMQGRIAGYQAYTTRSGVVIPLVRGRVPAIFIDEAPATAAAVSVYPVTEIAMIKVIKTAFPGTPNGNNGAILIYTRDNEDE